MVSRKLLACMALVIATTVTTSALAQPLREETSQPTAATRIGVESAVTLAASAMSIGGGYWAAISATRHCVDRSVDWGALGCGFRGGAVLMGVTFGTMPVMLTLGSYISHRSMHGKGKWYAALTGSAVGLGAGIGMFAMTPSNKNVSDAGVVAGVVAGAILASSVPVLALELSHGRQRKLERQTSAKRHVIPVASALPGGGWIGVTGTL